MKKYISIFSISVLLTVFSACSNSNINEDLVKKWTLVKVDGFGSDKNEILGINHIYFNLKEDETFTARWYDQEKMTDFKDMSGRWLSTDVEDKIDLFLFYGPNEKETMIFTITKLEGDEMVMKISEIDHFFKAK